MNEPSTFEQMIGQKKQKHFVKLLIAGAKRKEIAVPSMLVIGPSGIGKTTFAKVVAKEAKVDFEFVAAGPEITPFDLCLVLEKIKRNSILFIDEIQSLMSPTQEILFQALDQRRIPTPGENKLDRDVWVPIADFTLIGATNYPGKVRPELRNRIQIIELNHYSADEIRSIAVFFARSIGKEVSDSAAISIAKAAKGIARLAMRTVQTLDTIFPNAEVFEEHHVRELFHYTEVNESGLNKVEQNYLQTLFNQPDNSGRLGVISSTLGIDPLFLRREVEPNLIKLGLIVTHTPRGRALSRQGKAYVARSKEGDV